MRPFDEIVEEHGAVVMRVCRALLGLDEAQDAWSDTFLAALRAYPDLRPDSNVRGWLVTIAHHKAVDVIRKRERSARPTDALPEIPVEDQLPEPGGTLRDALDALPGEQRRAVIYRYLADLSYADVAALLDSSESAARRSAADGIAKLRTTYSKGTAP
jgi:RNA polymerase sigma factor (sigma-70 family)